MKDYLKEMVENAKALKVINDTFPIVLAANNIVSQEDGVKIRQALSGAKKELILEISRVYNERIEFEKKKEEDEIEEEMKTNPAKPRSSRGSAKSK